MTKNGMLIALVVISSTLPSAANAAAKVTGTITKIATSSSGVIYIKTNSTTYPMTGSPSCHTDNFWQFAFDGNTPTGEKLLAQLLSAKLSGITVEVNSTSSCAPVSYIQGLDYIVLE